MDQDSPLTVEDVATLVAHCVSISTVRRDVASGVLPARKVGSQWLIEPADAEAYRCARDLIRCGDAALAGIRAQAQERLAARKGKRKNA